MDYNRLTELLYTMQHDAVIKD